MLPHVAAPPVATELAPAGAGDLGVVERGVGELVRGLHEGGTTREVEQLALVDRGGEVDELHRAVTARKQ